MTKQTANSGDGAEQSLAPDNEQIAVRRAKLRELREAGNAFPNDFRPDAATADLVAEFGQLDGDAVAERSGAYRLAGRITAVRKFGKSTFLKLEDGGGAIQLFANQGELGADAYAAVKRLDLGDIVGVEGSLFRTRTGELTLRASAIRLLVKTLRPLPEKWHGLSDKETRYRRRYVDLIANPEVRATFLRRTEIVGGIRSFLASRGFVEVETPMMQPLAGGAAARPFVTHHNALSMDLYLRVAPELYLKRLVVGGFERVFELNRNFRNEGLSRQHNPEFTMCEFYQAYATYTDLMKLIETLIAELAGGESFKLMTEGGERVERVAAPYARSRELLVTFEGVELDFGSPFRRLSMAEAVAENSSLSPAEATCESALSRLADDLGIETAERSRGLGLLADIFERVAEPKLVQPTFVTGFPTEVSPLARRNDDDPRFVDRFELYVAGREIANGFSELNDPEDQRQRFVEQLAMHEAGDEEAHLLDEDYVRALEYGLPPTAGAGIGVDRLVMLLTDSASIRDVILFPHLRPEAG